MDQARRVTSSRVSQAPLRRRGRSGLFALATLIQDTFGPRPAFASVPVAPVPITPARESVMASVSTPTERAAAGIGGRLRARTSRSLPTSPPDGTPPPAVDSDGVDSDISDEHAEVWSLVRLAQQGDGDAFGLLYDRYVDTVFRFAYYRVNDRALAEDVTSETFVRALRRIRTISYQGRDIGAWFITIARNIVLDHLKSARHRLESTTAEILDPDTSESTETTVLSHLDSQRLMAAVAELGDEQRDCVMMRFVQGLSVAETAAALGKNDGAVKALQHRAVRKLATIIGDELR